MNVGNFQIGRYHAIIKKTYEDGSVSYETSFSDEEDLRMSVYAITRLIGQVVGTGTCKPKVLCGINVIRGKENIIKELHGIELDEDGFKL